MVSATSLRLGVVTSINGYIDDHVYAYAAFGRLMDALRERVGHFRLALSEAPKRASVHDHALAVPVKDVLRLPYMPSARIGMYKHWPVLRQIRQLEEQSDVVMVQLPFSPPTGLLNPHRPRLYQLTGDVLKVVEASGHYQGMARALAMTVAYGTHWMQQWLCHRPDARAVIHGLDMNERYGRPKGRVVVSSSLRHADLGSVPRTRPIDAPFRMLFVGMLRPEKGIDTLLDAYELVLKSIPNAELKLVGAQDAVSGGAAQNMVERLETLKKRGAVEFLGHRAFGPELFRCYADADVVVCPSRSEGTPRVLIEARGFGAVVVASNVGGIPTSVKDGIDGLLVPADAPRELAQALLRVAQDSTLRDRLRVEGLRRAEASTLERFADQIVEEVVCLAEGDRTPSTVGKVA
jgi:glycosyltransferase involved in cell wall biosynthesis